jgi:hypothetical protein
MWGLNFAEYVAEWLVDKFADLVNPYRGYVTPDEVPLPHSIIAVLAAVGALVMLGFGVYCGIASFTVSPPTRGMQVFCAFFCSLALIFGVLAVLLWPRRR